MTGKHGVATWTPDTRSWETDAQGWGEQVERAFRRHKETRAGRPPHRVASAPHHKGHASDRVRTDREPTAV
jgi:hypothetical protein